MKLEEKILKLGGTFAASAHLWTSKFDLDSVRVWKGRDGKWRLSGTVQDKSVLDIVGKSMLGPNKDPADVIIKAVGGGDVETLHANLTSSMESGTSVEITFTLLED